MGHKFSVVRGVKSDNYFKPGNAINEIWFGNLEIISRLPFGDSDMAQAGWPEGGLPKIPWHNFIIPLKRLAKRWTPPDSAISHVSRRNCTPSTESIHRALRPVYMNLLTITLLYLLVILALRVPITLRRRLRRYRLGVLYHPNRIMNFAVHAWVSTASLLMGLLTAMLMVKFWMAMDRTYHINEGPVFAVVLILVCGICALFILSARDVYSLLRDWASASKHVNSGYLPILNESVEEEVSKAYPSGVELYQV